MGWWGHLGAPKQRGIAVYTLSPYEQRAFAGAAHQAVFNTFRRFTGQAFYIGIPLGLGYALFSWGKENHRTLKTVVSVQAIGCALVVFLWSYFARTYRILIIRNKGSLWTTLLIFSRDFAFKEPSDCPTRPVASLPF